MSGILTKLRIVPFADSKMGNVPIPIGVPMVAQFNPESFTVKKEYETAPSEVFGQQGSEGKFHKVNPSLFSFDILLDGTGGSGPKIPVLPAIKTFETITGFNGIIHRPNFFMISLGSILLKCVLKSYSINYQMFKPDGRPLRAVISTEWQEIRPKELDKKWLNLLSPDVTHSHLVNEGENLPLICYRTYKDSSYYYKSAEKNGLNNLRKLKSAQKINLYPLK